MCSGIDQIPFYVHAGPINSDAKLDIFESVIIKRLPTNLTRNLQTQSVLFALLTVAVLACSGCQPSSKKTDDNQSKSTATSDQETSTEETKDATKDVIEPGTIVGDLGSIDWDSKIDEEIVISGDLVVVDTYDLARRGQIKVARKRLYVPTSQIDPNDADPSATSFEGGSNVAKVTQSQKFNDLATITIDDDSADQNIFPPTLFPELGQSLATVRVGSTIHGVSGKLVKAGRNLLLVADQPLDWTPAERPERPDIGNANVTVSSFNVLNYFTTIDDGSNNARGADSNSELDRQQAKIVSAILALDADVIGLMEIENNIDAEKRLVDALNRELGSAAFQGCGLPDDFRSAPGGQDSIRVGMIFRTDKVKPVGRVSLIKDDAFLRARTPIVQSFQSVSEGTPFTVIVNHFKSKGGADRADVANKNKGDGQGAYNAVRRAQSLAICQYIADLEENNNNKPRVLVIGDLNAYDQEDPIDAMRANGLVDLNERFNQSPADANEKHYSYIYRGQSGSLDHAMATTSLADDVTGIATWHINADEPRFLDYNQEYNPKPLYQPDPFRSSDHDPVLIGISN